MKHFQASQKHYWSKHFSKDFVESEQRRKKSVRVMDRIHLKGKRNNRIISLPCS